MICEHILLSMMASMNFCFARGLDRGSILYALVSWVTGSTVPPPSPVPSLLFQQVTQGRRKRRKRRSKRRNLKTFPCLTPMLRTFLTILSVLWVPAEAGSVLCFVLAHLNLCVCACVCGVCSVCVCDVLYCVPMSLLTYSLFITCAVKTVPLSRAPYSMVHI